MGKVVNLKDLNYGDEYEVEIVEADDLPRGCSETAWIISTDYVRYTIYKDCVTHLLYAVSEDENV